MNEGQQLLMWLAKIMIVVGMAVLYRLGGWKNKVFRRFVAPVLYIAAICGIAHWKGIFSWILITPLPFDIYAMTRGYGKHGDKLSKKLLLRLIPAVIVSLAYIGYAIYLQRWSVYALHCIVSISGSTLLGTFNQTAEGAASEEANIGLCYRLFPIMMI